MLVSPDLLKLPAEQRREAFVLLEELKRRETRRKLWTLYLDTGPLRRELYVKHLEFFRAGATHRERLFQAANRVGKTEGAGGYELTLHATGVYPPWWEGRRFDRPIRAWAAGDTGKTTRDIIQLALLGPPSEFGTGLIPGDNLGRTPSKQGVPDAVDSIEVKHVTGGWSRIGLKSYDQGRKSFQGTAQDIVWLDEEPDMAVYAECLLRTMTTNGLVMLTLTPLLGVSEVVRAFMVKRG